MSLPSSIVFLSTPTSGTASLWRIINLLCPSHAQRIKIAEDLFNAGRGDELASWVPEPMGHIYQYNAPQVANLHLADTPAKLIVNFRDPRDLACNQFYWAQQHPIIDKTEQEIAAFRARVLEQGIDRYVLGVDNNVLFKAFQAIGSRIANGRDDTLVVSYAQLCLDFDAMVRRIAAFVGMEEEKIPWPALEPMRAANLTSNPNWIGHKWSGSDAQPGRFRGELQPATIAVLDERYTAVLAYLRHLEQPHLRHFLAPIRDQLTMQGVLVGQDGQLFLTNDSNDVIGQITGRKPLPRTDMFRIAAAHRARRVFGATVCNFRYEHMLIPNKECALQDFLPAEIAFESAGPRPVAQYLAAPAARIWRPFYEAQLLSPNGDERFFSRTDTHWNHAGALRYLSAFLSAQVPHLHEPLERMAMRRFTGKQQGDLGRCLEMEPEDIQIIAPQKARAQMIFSNEISNEGCVRWYRNASAPTRERAFVLHDSFTMWLLNIIPELCLETLFFHGTIFDYEVIERFNPSVVLCLQVERFFNRVPDTGGNMLAFIEAEEERKGASRHFADAWADYARGAL